MSNRNRPRFLALIWLTVAGLALLAMGALKLREDFLTRGLPHTLPEPILEGGVRLGINVSLEGYDDAALDDHLTQIHETSIRHLKQTFYFNDAFDWAESDRLISTLVDHDLLLVPLLDGDPANNFAPPENPAVFAEWAGEFAARYQNTLHHYIIWDEPNLTSHWGNQPVNPAEYAALLMAASQAIRQADPDALIVAAPLAPTTEKGPTNLADPLFLQELYESGASGSFDIVAGKPYGFDTGLEDRGVAQDRLNFSRAILLREVLEQNGDAAKAVWAGNWGWNSLPPGWSGSPSIWGQTSESEQASQTVAAVERARREWPWMGIMFLENWQPGTPKDDSRWGFSIQGRETATAVQTYQRTTTKPVAFPGFHQAGPEQPAQVYSGGWRFSPEYGADISESGDKVSFTFWGTDVGLRVRRANFRARLYITIDGKPANALPRDENGSMLILTAAHPFEDTLSMEWIARDLSPGQHTMTITASRGWDQWALNGFSVGYRPSDTGYSWGLVGLGATTVIALFLAIQAGKRAEWGTPGQRLALAFGRLSQRQQLALTAVTAALVTLTGWLTWGQQAAGLYRRLGDGGQLALTAVAASIFYVTPTFFVYIIALGLLFLLIYLRPAWGVALIAFCFPFYVLPKPILNYRFSPVEIFTLITLAAFILSRLFLSTPRSTFHAIRSTLHAPRSTLHTADIAVFAFTTIATFSLLFTERLDVATNEWRAVILEPAIFYLLLRGIRLKEREMWVIIDSFVLGGLLVASYGLWQYGTGQGLITAEGGLMRLRSVYGSPNNVALYLGRIFPLLAAMALLGAKLNGRRRWVYGVLLLPIGLAILLTFSKGALFLGIPAALLFIFWIWQRKAGRRTWPWFIAFFTLGVGGVFLAQRIPQLAGRFDLRGATGVFRVNLWRATLNMIADHPLFGVGLDNFLYAYRGRYIFDAAWQEPNLSHPHNLLLDLGSRLGLLGLLAGVWMLWSAGRTLWRAHKNTTTAWLPVVVGLSAAMVDMLIHGLVDHSFFLVDLAFAFYLILGTAVWLQKGRPISSESDLRPVTY